MLLDIYRNVWTKGIMYYTIILSLLFATYECCPSPCICKWKNGKQTAECVNKDLLIIPEGLESTTQVLNFSGNNLKSLHRDEFLQLGVINLQKIYLANCGISAISETAFKGLAILVELDLSNNLLDAVPSASFHECPSLRKLTLTRNPIKFLDQNAFNFLPSLKTLELGNCDISRVDLNAFQGLNNLEWLHLESNKMNTFPASLHLPSSLRYIYLQDNPWTCDCHLLELHSFLLKFPYLFSIEPLCTSPHNLAGRKIKSLPDESLACLAGSEPNDVPSGDRIDINELS
ncbi:hypothetical protein JTB14_010862 [Gonioctena quinquepunctata]|nr:hypothetical protein JTB14_010862 [Gonioctena quinquepunctata]